MDFIHFTKTVTSKASKSLVFVFFLQKIAILIQKQKACLFTHKFGLDSSINHTYS